MALLVAGLYVFGVLGINICYHRLLTHRGFACPQWLEHALAILGVCCGRTRRRTGWRCTACTTSIADEDGDPHSPLVELLLGRTWAGCWSRPATSSASRLSRATPRDLVPRSVLAWLERRGNWIRISAGSVAAYSSPAGFAAVALSGGSLTEATQFGLSWLVWGVSLRTVLVWHITWSVNSVTHVWGYRNYDTPDDSRNNCADRRWSATAKAGTTTTTPIRARRATATLVGARRDLARPSAH